MSKGRIFHLLLIVTIIIQSLFAENKINMFNEGKYNELLKKYDIVLNKNPNMEEAHFGKGATLYKMGEYIEALREFEKAITVKDPIKKSAVYYNIGNALFKSGKLQQSLQFYKKAILLNPKDYDAKYNYELVNRLLKKNQQKKSQKEKSKDKKSKKKQDQRQNNNQKQKQADKKNEQKEQSDMSKFNKNDNKKESKKEQYKPVLDALREKEEQFLKEKLKANAPGIKRGKDW